MFKDKISSINTSRQTEFIKIKCEFVMAILAVLIVVGTYINALSYIAFLVSAIAVIWMSEEDRICLLMFVMPFANIFKSSPTSQSFVTYLVLFYVIYKLISCKIFSVRFMQSLMFLVAFLLFQFLVSINILRSIKFVANILFIYFALKVNAKDDGKKIYLSYITGIVVTSFVAVFNLISDMDSYIGQTGLSYASVYVMRFTGLYGDPNYYSVNLIISLCLVVLLNHKKQMGNLFATMLAATLVVFAIMTYSKSAFLMLLLPLLMLLYSKMKSRKYFVFLVLVGATLVFSLNLFAGKIEWLEVVSYRFAKSDDLSSLVTNRPVIWKEYLAHLNNSDFTLFWGSGFGADMLGKYVAHNTYIDLLYYLGIVGTAMLLNVLFALMRVKKSVAKRNVLNYCVWLCVLTMYFFLSEFFYFDWAFHILIAILTSKTNLAQVQESKKSKTEEKIYA